MLLWLCFCEGDRPHAAGQSRGVEVVDVCRSESPVIGAHGGMSQDFPPLGATPGRPEWDSRPRVAWAATETGFGTWVCSLVLKKIHELMCMWCSKF